MLRIIFSLFLLTSLSSAFESSYEFAEDKRLHFNYSAGIAAFVDGSIYLSGVEYSPLQRASVAIGASTLVGVAKEVMDEYEPGNRFDEADLFYDVAGALTGAAISELCIYLFGVNPSETLSVAMRDDATFLSYNLDF